MLKLQKVTQASGKSRARKCHMSTCATQSKSNILSKINLHIQRNIFMINKLIKPNTAKTNFYLAF